MMGGGGRLETEAGRGREERGMAAGLLESRVSGVVAVVRRTGVIAAVSGVAAIPVVGSAASSHAAGASRTWRSLPKAPIGGRVAASTVWTGKVMIVWGGPLPRSDGATYNPVTRTWRRIAAAPSGVLGDGGSAAAWTPQGMVVWVGNSPGGPAAGAVYSPRNDS
jgi:hypothetical protein